MNKRHLTRLFLGLAIPWSCVSPAAADRCEEPLPAECVHADARPLEDVHFAYGATQEGEAWVARFEKGNTEPTWRTPIGGDGRQTVEAVALAKENTELLAAGGSTSSSLEKLTGENRGGRDGYVLRLDVETGEILGGTLLGGEGDELLTGVAEGAEGEVLVAGHASESLEDFGDPPAQITRVLSSSAMPEDGMVFVFLENVGVSAMEELSRFGLGELPIKNPRVWIDCNGIPMVGVPIEPLASNCLGNPPDLVYQQDQIHQDFSMDSVWGGPYLGSPPGGFGFHALRWKQYHANATSTPPYLLDWSRVPSGTDVPKRWDPRCTDASTLDYLETQVFLKSGAAADPPGGWSCGNHANISQLALYAAYLHDRWGTPVYTHFGYWETLQTGPAGIPLWVTQPVAIEKTVFEPFCTTSSQNAYNGERLADLCDLSVNQVSALTCTTSGGIPGVAGTGFILKLKYFHGMTWKNYMVVTSSGLWDPGASGWQRWYEPGVYVMDPPDGSEDEVAILEAASHQLSGLVVREGSVLLTRIEGGAEKCTDEMEGLLPASE